MVLQAVLHLRAKEMGAGLTRPEEYLWVKASMVFCYPAFEVNDILGFLLHNLACIHRLPLLFLMNQNCNGGIWLLTPTNGCLGQSNLKLETVG